MTDDPKADDPKGWEVATRLVRGGTTRSQYGETAEALYLTQSFIYDTAEAADARFAGNDPGFIYTRYGNPTVKMFEDRLALLEGAEDCRTAASGMAAVHLALTGLLTRRRPCGGGQGPVRLRPLDPQQLGAALRPRGHLRGRGGHAGLEGGGATEHQGVPDREPGQSAPGDHRHRGGGGDRP